jgi:lipoprotein-anchoring transpeptidase ErfK/SrfK
MLINRRLFVIGAPLAVAGCASQPVLGPQAAMVDPRYRAMYGEIDGEPHPVDPVDLTQIDEKFLRREISYQSSEAPGTVIVDPSARYAYLIQGGGRAIRYGVGVGKTEAFNFNGVATIGRKAEWPHWTPTGKMIARDPERYGPVAAGMTGGDDNPLGARALYLYRGGKDSFYRLHGTIEPYSIGTMVSSGCIRFLNQDIIDLYNRVPVGAKVIVRPAHATEDA